LTLSSIWAASSSASPPSLRVPISGGPKHAERLVQPALAREAASEFHSSLRRARGILVSFLHSEVGLARLLGIAGLIQDGCVLEQLSAVVRHHSIGLQERGQRLPRTIEDEVDAAGIAQHRWGRRVGAREGIDLALDVPPRRAAVEHQLDAVHGPLDDA